MKREITLEILAVEMSCIVSQLENDFKRDEEKYGGKLNWDELQIRQRKIGQLEAYMDILLRIRGEDNDI